MMNATTGLCAPLRCAGAYRQSCPAAAAKRCDADPRCHGFALYKAPWRETRAEFFRATAGVGALTAQADWTAWTKPIRGITPDTATKFGSDEEQSTSIPLFVSQGPAGPWRPVSATITDGASFSIAAPWFAQNGTAWWVLQTGEWPSEFPSADRLGNIGMIIKADSWEGPYEIIGTCVL